MQHLRLSRSADTKTHTWTKLQDSVIQIDTWKGQYVIDNPDPSNYDHHYDLRTYSTYPISLWVYDWFSIPDYAVWHPLLNKRIKVDVNIGDVYAQIHDDIIKWISEQPPQPDWKGAEQDRESVESTFCEISNLDRSKTK
jgi:hypothetical protein